MLTARRISHYEIDDPLDGGSGLVQRGRDLRSGLSVALKILPRALLVDPDLRRRFVHEAKSASALGHPHIGTIDEIGELADNSLFVAMPFYEGGSLEQKLRGTPLPLVEALGITIEVAEALAAAHRHGIVHRDLKPSNILFTNEGSVKVVDFGQARLRNGTPPKSALALKTAMFQSPELIAGGPVDERTDVWSLGGVLYQMLTGRPPFEADNAPRLRYSITYEYPEPLCALRPELPLELESVVGKALARRIDERYRKVDEMLIELLELRSECEPETDLDARPAPARARSYVARPPAAPQRSKMILAGATAAILFLAAAGWVARSRLRRHAPVAPVVDPVQLTSYKGVERMPAINPRGDQIAFVWSGESLNNEDIYVTRLDSAQPSRLTTDAASEGSPAWSADSQRLAFLRERSPIESDLYVMPAKGGPERHVAVIAGGVESGLSWSFDGQSIAAIDRSSPDEPLGIYVVSVVNGSKRLLTAPPARSMVDSHPQFSPDGTELAFQRQATPAFGDVYVAALDGGVRRLTALETMVNGLAWGPDGHSVVFSAGRKGEFSLWEVSSSAGEPHRLAGIPSNSIEPSVSVASHMLVFSAAQVDASIWHASLHDPANTEEEQIISSQGSDGSPMYSPDGSRIAFASDRSGAREIWIANNDGSGTRQLTALKGYSGAPRWSPDGSQIVFHTRLNGLSFIAIIPSGGGQVRRITAGRFEDVVPSFSRDGEWIYFSSDRSGQMQIWKAPVSDTQESEEPVQVTHAGGFAAFESVDGEFLYYTKNRNLETSVWHMPLPQGTEEVVIERVPSGWGNWALSGNLVYYLDRDTATTNEDGWDVRCHDLATGKSWLAGGVNGLIVRDGPGLSVSPDGKLLLVAKDELAAADLMTLPIGE